MKCREAAKALRRGRECRWVCDGIDTCDNGLSKCVRIRADAEAVGGDVGVSLRVELDAAAIGGCVDVRGYFDFVA